MSSGQLRVTTAHLRELAAKQGKAAAEMRTATYVAAGVDTSVRITHGVIAWSTAVAVEAIAAQRRTAGKELAAASDALSNKLIDAAAAYDQIDEALGGQLDREMRPR